MKLIKNTLEMSIVETYKQGYTTLENASKHNCHPSKIKATVREYRQMGFLAPEDCGDLTEKERSSARILFDAAKDLLQFDVYRIQLLIRPLREIVDNLEAKAEEVGYENLTAAETKALTDAVCNAIEAIDKKDTLLMRLGVAGFFPIRPEDVQRMVSVHIARKDGTKESLVLPAKSN